MPTLILCFHRVADPLHGGRSMLAISPEDFRRTLEIVGARYRFVTLEEGARASRERTAVVTFDDGYADNLYTAAPILQEMGIPATFFISTGFIAKGVLFPADALDACLSSEPALQLSQGLQELLGDGYWRALDTLAAVEESAYWQLLADASDLVKDHTLRGDPHKRPMTTDELAELAALPGVTIGAHTVTHRRLSALSAAETLQEITQSLAWLKSQGLPTEKFFAYPFGQKNDMSRVASAQMRAEGHEPLSTLPALVSGSSAFWLRRWGLPRLSVGPAETPLIAMLVKILPWATPVAPLWLAALAVRRRLRSGPK